ncbi:MAG: hypothetical protein HYU28_04610 [Actinobacteria bacterium]|nr:hypothetical protein [Actinomycetota bacterium]
MLGAVPKIRVERIIGALVVVAAILYVFLQLQPEALLSNTTANGGDTGAHVWWPAFLRDHVFPKLRLSGWAPDWYAGFPVGHYYFPAPPLLVVLLDVVIPYNVAFKLVTALGPLLLPAAAYVFARGLKAPWPAPPLFAAATLPFLFFTPPEGPDGLGHNFRIMGGNLPSSLAGEFSFSIALALALFFLAALARALDERRRLWLPALLLALTVMSHGIVTLFAAAGAIVIWLARGPARGLRVAGAAGGVAFLLTAIWSLPVVGRVAYMTDMGWAKLTTYRFFLLHDDLGWVLVLAGAALIAGAAYLRRATLELAALVGIFALVFRFIPEGRVWNLRILPFYLLPLFFLAAMGVTEVVNLIRRGLESPRVAAFVAAGGGDQTGARPTTGLPSEPEQPSPRPSRRVSTEETARRASIRRRLVRAGATVAHVTAVVGLVAALAYAHRRPLSDYVDAATGGPRELGTFLTNSGTFVDDWARWNNNGYERKDSFPEFQEIMDTLDGLPVPYGQRLLWERLSAINTYGSDLALELIPYFTEGKIGSMEGLYFESASSTPYHFLTVAELASEPSNPVRGLDYGNINEDFDRGVKHLEMMGVRFYLAGSDLAKQKACGITDGRTLEQFLAGGGVCARTDLRFRELLGDAATAPKVARWALFEVADADLVEPLAYAPVVLDDVHPRDWREPATRWFNDESAWPRAWAGDGPPQWARVASRDAATASLGSRLPAVNVGKVEVDDDSIRFEVDRTGVPVLVKVSYFPNWQASGARGPWRITPNFMVVIPTDHDVTLHYGRTPIDRVGIVLTILGIVGLVALARWRPFAREPEAVSS